MALIQNSLAHNKNTSPIILLRSIPLLGLLVLVVVLATAGAIQAVLTIRENRQHGRTFAVGQPITTTFGTLTLSKVEKLDGLTAQDLAGMTHGVQALVREDKVQLQLALQWANHTADPVRYAPEQFTLISSNDQVGIGPVGGTLQNGLLAGRALINAALVFVAPRTNQPLWISYRDPGNGRAIRIAIGAADPNAGEVPIAIEADHTQVKP